MTSDMSQVTEISTRNESSDSMLGERSQEEEMETSTRNKSPDFLLGEKSQRSSRSTSYKQDVIAELMHKEEPHAPRTPNSERP